MVTVLQFDAAAATDPGWRFKENQDAVLLDTQVWQGTARQSFSGRTALLVGVADGLAHAPCASRASRVVLEELVELAADGLVGKVTRMIHRRMTSVAMGTRCEGMASTLAAVQFSAEEVRVISVGDTRVYLWRDQRLRQITVDHTIANRMVREGDLAPENAFQAGSLYADLDSALVASEFEDEFDVFSTSLQPLPGDYWLCVSDGITGALPDAEIENLLASAQDPVPEAIVVSLLGAAKRNRCSDDNLSAIAVHVRSSSAV